MTRNKSSKAGGVLDQGAHLLFPKCISDWLRNLFFAHNPSFEQYFIMFVPSQGQACAIMLKGLQSKEIQTLLAGARWKELCQRTVDKLTEVC